MSDLRDEIHLNDDNFKFWADSIRQRVKTANDTSTRSRYTLIFLSLVSASFIMAVFSYFYSWNKEYAYYFAANTTTDAVRDLMLGQYFGTQTYQLPILGIKIMVSDIQIFGPIIMVIVSTWNFYEVRREHFTTMELLRDVKYLLDRSHMGDHPKAIILKQEVYHALMAYTVFNVFSYDHPIHLDGDFPPKKFEADSDVRRFILAVLIGIPLISIVFIAMTRILTFSVLRSSITGKIHMFDENMPPLWRILLILSCLLAAFASFVCYFNIDRVFGYFAKTREQIRIYRTWH